MSVDWATLTRFKTYLAHTNISACCWFDLVNEVYICVLDKIAVTIRLFWLSAFVIHKRDIVLSWPDFLSVFDRVRSHVQLYSYGNWDFSSNSRIGIRLRSRSSSVRYVSQHLCRLLHAILLDIYYKENHTIVWCRAPSDDSAGLWVVCRRIVMLEKVWKTIEEEVVSSWKWLLLQKRLR